MELQAKLNHATLNHAQSTVFSRIGVNGQFVTRHAELEAPPEHEVLNDQPLLEERNALKPLKLNLATLTIAQLTAYKAHGENGPSATRHAEEVNKHDQEQLSSKPPLEELLAEPAALSKLATKTHAQLTALWLYGKNGAHVTRHAAEEAKAEQETLKSNPNSEAKFVMSHLKPKFATHKNAQLTVLWENGTHGKLAARLVEEDHTADHDLLYEHQPSVVKFVKLLKNLRAAIPIHAQLTVL